MVVQGKTGRSITNIICCIGITDCMADRDKGAIIHEWEFNIDKSLPTTRIQDVRFPVMTTLSYSEYEAFGVRINFLNVLKF